MRCSLLTLSCYLDGELEARRRGELEAHLVGCQRCRAGLGHLREESERISGLARVHVGDGSALAILEQTGVLGADQREPDVSEGLQAMPPEPAPRWFEGPSGDRRDEEEEARSPWRRQGWDPGEPAEAPPAPSPWTPSFEPAAGIPPVAADLESPAARTGEHAETEPAAEPATEAAEAPIASETPAPHGAMRAPEAPGATHGPAGAPPSPPETPSEPATTASPPSPPGLRRRVRLLRAPVQDRSAPAGEPQEQAGDTRDVEDGGSGAGRAAFGTEPSPVRGQAALPFEDEPAAPPEHGAASEALETAAGVAGDPFAGDPDVPLSTPRSPSSDIEPAPLYPLTDEDVLERPAAVERFSGGPMRAERPGLVGRVREKMAVRRALARPAAEMGEGVELVSGLGAPPRRGRVRASADVNAAATQSPVMPPPPSPGAPLPPPAHGVPPIDDDVLDRAWRDLDEATPGGLRHSLGLDEPVDERQAAAPPVHASAAAPSRDGRRLLGLFAAGVVILTAVGVESGRTTSPLPTSQATSPSTSSPTARPSAAARKPALTVPAPASAAPAAPSAPASGALSGTQTLGDGGHGYQVKDVRYGIHPGDFRIVFDLVPAQAGAAGNPPVTVGQLDPTTLVVAIGGAVASGTAGQVPPGGAVTAASIMPSSPVTGTVGYQLKLAHPVTVKAYFVQGPLRLVLDLS